MPINAKTMKIAAIHRKELPDEAEMAVKNTMMIYTRICTLLSFTSGYNKSHVLLIDVSVFSMFKIN